MRHILHTFHVNRNILYTCPVYVASGMSEPMLEQWWFAVQVMVCGAGVIVRIKTNL